MSFELPDLARKSYQQLVTDMVRRIPQYTRQWTDFNDSDPGITLLQLLAWLDESLLYQANKIPLQTQQNFLRQVLGLNASTDQTPYSKAAELDHDFDFLALREVLAQVEQGAPINSAGLQKAVLSYVAAPYLALSLSDVETLCRETNRVIDAEQQKDPSTGLVLRVRQAYSSVVDEATIAYILSNARWLYQTPALPPRAASVKDAAVAATLRKVLVYQPQDDQLAEQTLLLKIRNYLAPRILLGSQVGVRAAQLTDINLTLGLRCATGTRLEVMMDMVMNRLLRYFLPVLGGPQGQGWPYGQAPDSNDLRQFIFTIPGVVAIDAFNLNFIPTLELNKLAQLGVNTLLADLPPGEPGMFYNGLPRLRTLDIVLGSVSS
jgi:hypothetical protein